MEGRSVCDVCKSTVGGNVGTDVLVSSGPEMLERGAWVGVGWEAGGQRRLAQ